MTLPPLQNVSWAEWLASQPESVQQATLQELAPNETEQAALEYLWEFWARPKQLEPLWDWQIWLILAGRGFGKTRVATEWARRKAESMPGSRGAFVASTAADARDILVEGESGILNISPSWFMPKYEPSKRRLTWPNGSRATVFSADEPDRLRGPQHHWAIGDELAAWRYPEAYDHLMFGLRLGNNPQAVFATTPRPTPLIRQLLKDATVHVTKGTSYENKANLAQAFFRAIIKKYEGTRLGRQELNAEVLDDVPGALWTRSILEETRVNDVPSLSRIVVGVDPEATASDDSSETGIVVAGRDENDHGYVLDDASVKETPAGWGAAVVKAFDRWNADRIIVETNQGGDMVEYVVQTAAQKLYADGVRKSAYVPVTQVRASRGKYTRAEPVSALYEQKRIHHVGVFARLEDEMCTWVPGETSPDHMDALVWAMTELLVGEVSEATTVENPYW